MKKPAIAIILGRKGSKGVPGKNTLRLLGRPAMHYPMLAAKNSRHLDYGFVSTDDPEIADAGKAFGFRIIERPPELCTDTALFEDALIHGYENARTFIGVTPAYVAILMCNAVTVDANLIDQAIDSLEANPEADSAVTVSLLNMYSPLRARKLNSSGYLDPFVPFETFGDPATLSCDRDSQGDVYFADMSHSVTRGNTLEHIREGLLPQRWMGKKILPVPHPFGCDIDAGWQIAASLSWLEERGFTANSTPYDAPVA
ncbi:MAG: cytidylyltransferase [Spirochaetales bacterium]|nr:cytidylyltransferase [Spirochaetales bacterium]